MCDVLKGEGERVGTDVDRRRTETEPEFPEVGEEVRV